jgi:hypothetical protein
MTDMSLITDAELVAEFARRKKAAEDEENARRDRYADNLVAVLTKEGIDAFVPDHARTSCSDLDLGNGWGAAEYGPRCNRCALLEALRGDGWPRDFVLDVSIRRRSP